jgi:hypothetical protein
MPLLCLRKTGVVMSFSCDAYGLTLASMEALPGFLRGGRQEGNLVHVASAQVPTELPNPIIRTPRFEADERTLLLRTRSVANFLLVDGKSVTIDRKPSSCETHVSQLLYSWCIGGVLVQRRANALHASSISTHWGGIAFCGHSGAGKSTLATTLVRRGAQMLDDNITVIDASQTPSIIPGHKRISLCDDAARNLSFEHMGEPLIGNGLRKFRFELLSSQWAGAPALLRCIYLLDRGASSFEIDELNGGAKARALLDHGYGVKFISGHEAKAQYARRMITLASRCRMFRLGIPAGCPSETVADRLLARWDGAECL